MENHLRPLIMVGFFALLTAAPGHADRIAPERADRDVVAAVEKSAAVLSILHRKAKKALVNAAQDRAFGDYFSSHGHDHRQRAKARIEAISLAVQSDFRVEEMCLIDPDGNEISRIVGRHVADDLSSEEAAAGFFAPGFAQRPRTVHVSSAYLSPDADKWVVAYVTPVVRDDRKRAILHYEHGLDAYHDALERVRTAAGVRRFALDGQGRVLWRDDARVAIDKVGDSDDPDDYFEPFTLAGHTLSSLLGALDRDEPIVDEDGHRHRVAHRQVADWHLIAVRTLRGTRSARAD